MEAITVVQVFAANVSVIYNLMNRSLNAPHKIPCAWEDDHKEKNRERAFYAPPFLFLTPTGRILLVLLLQYQGYARLRVVLECHPHLAT